MFRQRSVSFASLTLSAARLTRSALLPVALLLAVSLLPQAGLAQEAAKPPKSEEPAPSGNLSGMTRLDPEADVWVDSKRKRVILRSTVCLRQGPLEMFACLTNSKEHESIVSVRTKAYLVHAALLAVGAEPGVPVTFQPEFKPASGTEIAIHLFWTDEKGVRRNAKAQDWIQSLKTHKELESNWVFAGSGFWESPDKTEKYYRAEEGDLVCVANFPSALLDLPVESSQDAESLVFEAWTDRIPPLGTEVMVVLLPQAKKAGEKDKEKPVGGKSTEEPAESK